MDAVMENRHGPKPTGFLEYRRKPVPYRDEEERLQDYGEIIYPAR